MDEIKKTNNQFIGYEYKDITVMNKQVSIYIDAYENFGWQIDENTPIKQEGLMTKLKFKRNRKLINRTELTRLQRHFEACIDEINALERSKKNKADVVSLSIGIIGCAFMAGSVFAVVNEPPIIWLCIVLAIPGFIGWILPYFVYKRIIEKKTKEVTPLIEAKYDEMYTICEKGHELL